MIGDQHDGIDITWTPGPKPGVINIVITFAGIETYTDALNVISAKSRDKFLEQLLEERGGVDRDAVAAELEKIAAQVFAATAAKMQKAAINNDRASLLAKADEVTAARLAEMDDDIREEAESLLVDPRLVDVILNDIERAGVVGEQSLGMTSYLLATSRLLSKPLAATIQALTGTGKSYVPERVASLIPDEAKVIATDITMNALYYMEPGGLMHKFVIAGERKRGNGDDHAEATRALREILSAGQLTKMVPVKSPSGQMTSRLLWQPGPIAYVDSTTNTEMFDEDANRALLLGTDESAEQTARIVIAQAIAAERDPVDIDSVALRHHAMHRMLKRVHVRVPFATAIAEAMPKRHQNARRAMPLILAMIRAIALLHQQQRSDAVLQHGDVISAAPTDYAIARRLLLEPLGRALGGVLPSAVSRFGNILKQHFGTAEFTSAQAQLVDPALSARSKANEYLGTLANAGIVECVELSRGPIPARWKVVGDVPIGGAMWLPTLDQVEGAR